NDSRHRQGHPAAPELIGHIPQRIDRRSALPQSGLAPSRQGPPHEMRSLLLIRDKRTTDILLPNNSDEDPFE
ncbi:hypothetical protein, partial [Bradyrhizobium diazoefficiens]